MYDDQINWLMGSIISSIVFVLLSLYYTPILGPLTLIACIFCWAKFFELRSENKQMNKEIIEKEEYEKTIDVYEMAESALNNIIRARAINLHNDCCLHNVPVTFPNILNLTTRTVREAFSSELIPNFNQEPELCEKIRNITKQIYKVVAWVREGNDKSFSGLYMDHEKIIELEAQIVKLVWRACPYIPVKMAPLDKVTVTKEKLKC
jgi:hypothetical protein